MQSRKNEWEKILQKQYIQIASTLDASFTQTSFAPKSMAFKIDHRVHWLVIPW